MYLGIDIGGTSIKFAVVDKNANMLQKTVIATPNNMENFQLEFFKMIQTMMDEHTIEGIGIAAPGIIDKNGKMITSGDIHYLTNVSLKQLVTEKFNKPVVVENDGNAVAIAERWIGNAQDTDHYLCIVLGTGVGGGIVINQQVFRGHNGMAGEFGWLLHREPEQKGSVEKNTVNYHAAVVLGLCQNYYRLKQEKNISVELTNNALEIFALEDGDLDAQVVIADFYQSIAVLLLNLTVAFNPEKILIGGAISENKTFIERLSQVYHQLKKRHDSLNAVPDELVAPILPAKLKNNAGIYGAIYILLQMLNKHKKGGE